MICKHAYELLNARPARRWFLGGLDSVADRIAIERVERLKELFGLRMAIEFQAEIVRDRLGALRRVRCRPPPILLGRVHCAQPGGLKLARRNELHSFVRVDLGPNTLGATGRELLEPERLVVGFLLPIDPTVAQ